MRMVLRVLSCMAVTAVLAAAAPAHAQQQEGPSSGLPVPRYVSLKADKVALRAGPGKTYAIRWIYQRSGLPVEITAEFENWRRIRDSDGTDGWVYHSLLSGRRTGVVNTRNKDDLIELREAADLESAVVAQLEPGVVAPVRECNARWCRISVQGYEGWLPQHRLWGVYPNEKLK